MSRPRYKWWGYVKAVIRDYPRLCRQYADLHQQAVTAGYGGMPGGGQAGRATEAAAVRELPAAAQREYEAVRRAVAQTERRASGKDRLTVVRLVLWDRSHTLEGAALAVPCSPVTAKRWHREFIRLVAKNLELLDE